MNCLCSTTSLTEDTGWVACLLWMKSGESTWSCAEMKGHSQAFWEALINLLLYCGISLWSVVRWAAIQWYSSRDFCGQKRNRDSVRRNRLGKEEWHAPRANVYWKNPRWTKAGKAEPAGSQQAESSGSYRSRSLLSWSRYYLLLVGCCSWEQGLSLNEHLATSHMTRDCRILKSYFSFEFFHMCNMKKSRGSFLLLNNKMFEKRWDGLLSHITMEPPATTPYCSSHPILEITGESSCACK